MTDDLERRLRDSLRAYADLVEAPDDGTAPAPRPSAPVRAGRRWRGVLLAAAAAVAVGSGTVWLLDRPDSGTAASSAADNQASAPAAAPESGPQAAASGAPEGAGDQAMSSVPVVGVDYPFDLSTHCGVRGADIGGVWFAADPPLVEGGGPPAGWADPVQAGTLTLVAADEAVFSDPAGHSVRLRADGSPRPPLCE